MDMKFCRKCGKELPPNGNFCPACGTRCITPVDTNAVQQTNHIQSAKSMQPVNRTQATNLTQPANRTQPTKPTQSMNRTQPTKPAQSMNQTQPTNRTQPANPTQPANKVSSQKKKSGSKLLMIWSLVLVTVIVVAGIGFLIILLKDNGRNEQQKIAEETSVLSDEIQKETGKVEATDSNNPGDDATKEEETAESSYGDNGELDDQSESDLGESQDAYESEDDRETYEPEDEQEPSESEDDGKLYDTEEDSETEETEDNSYILPDCDSRYLTKADFRGFGKKKLRLARNEIYARHGYKFKDKMLRAYFKKKAWYHPSRTVVTDDMFNKYEIANRDLILELES